MTFETAIAAAYLLSGLMALLFVAHQCQWKLENLVQSPFGLFTGYFAVSYLVVPSLDLFWGIYYWQRGYLESSLALALLGYVGFFLCLVWVWRVAAPKSSLPPTDRWRPVPNGAFAIITASLGGLSLGGLYLLFGLIRQSGGLTKYWVLRNYLSSGEGAMHLLLSIWQVLGMFVLAQSLLLPKASRYRRTLWWLSVGLVCTAFLVGLCQASRTRMLLPVVLWLWVWMVFKAREGFSPALKRAIWLGPIALALFGGVFGVARESASAGRLTTTTFRGVKLLTESAREYENLWYLLDHRERLDLRNGSTFMAALAIPIPRTLWPGKLVGAGPEIVNFMHPRGYVMSQKGNFSSITPGLPAEAFLNFGWVGLPLVAIASGLVLVLLVRSLPRTRGPASLCLWVVVTLRFTELQSMELFGHTFNILSSAFPFLIAGAISAYLRPSHSDTTSPIITSQGS